MLEEGQPTVLERDPVTRSILASGEVWAMT